MRVHRANPIGVTLKDILSRREYEYLRDLIGADWVGRHAEFALDKEAAQSLWAKVKSQ